MKLDRCSSPVWDIYDSACRDILAILADACSPDDDGDA